MNERVIAISDYELDISVYLLFGLRISKSYSNIVYMFPILKIEFEREV